MKHFVARYLIRPLLYLYFRFLMRRWSRLYRSMAEKEYRYARVRPQADLPALIHFIKPAKYVPDGWTKLWDAISYPGRTQIILDAPGSKEIGDCDEYALFLATAIDESVRVRENSMNWGTSRAFRTSMLTVFWVGDSGMGAHNVCAIQWFGNEGFSYMDYGVPDGPAKSYETLAKLVASRYDKNTQVLVWSRHDIFLNHIETRWV
jgi:hypothetical protein